MKILLVSPVPAWPLTKGSNQRTAHLRAALMKLGRTDFWLLTSEAAESKRADATAGIDGRLIMGHDGFGDWLTAANVPRGHRFWGWNNRWTGHVGKYRQSAAATGALGRLIAREDYDLIVCRYLWPVAKLRSALDGRKVLVDVDDFDPSVVQAKRDSGAIRASERWLLPLQQPLLDRRVRDALTTVNWAWFSNEDDIAKSGISQASLLRNIPATHVVPEGARRSPADADTLLFVGSFGYGPNRAGVAKFLQGIWPQLKTALPMLRLRLIGSGMDPQLQAQLEQTPGVEAVGLVDDLTQEYQRALAAIAPIPFGGGTNIKVLEALAHGRPCLASSAATRGLGDLLDQECGVYRCDTVASFVEIISQLRSDERLRSRLAANGRLVIAEKYSEKTFSAEVRRRVEQVLATAPAPEQSP